MYEAMRRPATLWSAVGFKENLSTGIGWKTPKVAVPSANPEQAHSDPAPGASPLAARPTALGAVHLARAGVDATEAAELSDQPGCELTVLP
ncbi:hypothetical protein ACWGLP_29975 [Streptomyces lydicus]